MIREEQREDLYKTISRDIDVVRFEGESLNNYCRRVVYSAIAKWMMCLFADRSFEGDVSGLVSKTHVTRTARDVLKSFIKVDPSISSYFCEDEKWIKWMESALLELGYINDGVYYFSYPTRKKKVAIANKTLVINLDTGANTVRGFGIWGRQTEQDIPLKDFLFVDKKPLDVFEGLLSNLSFDNFDQKHGMIEFYDPVRKRWEFYSDRNASSYEYYVLKIDDGLEYKLLKNTSNGKTSATIPLEYSKQGDADYLKWEIWRIILGVCSYCGQDAEAELAECYNGTAVRIKMFGYILPYLEQSLIGAMAWPVDSCAGIGNYITEMGMKKAVIELLDSLGIKIIEGKEN